MPSVGLSLLLARSQGLVAVTSAAAATMAVGLAFGGEYVGVPGMVEPIPAVRVFPAVIAAVATLCLLEPWRDFEITGARPLARRRALRIGVGAVVVVLAGSVLSENAGTDAILVLALLLYAALAVTVSFLGQHWWILVALAVYGQLFIQQYDGFNLGLGWGFAAVVLACPFYLLRGEATLGRSPT